VEQCKTSAGVRDVRIAKTADVPSVHVGVRVRSGHRPTLLIVVKTDLTRMKPSALGPRPIVGRTVSVFQNVGLINTAFAQFSRPFQRNRRTNISLVDRRRSGNAKIPMGGPTLRFAAGLQTRVVLGESATGVSDREILVERLDL